MKKTLLSILFIVICSQAFGTTYNIAINGLSYSPAITSTQIGDTVNIEANTTHPAVQVSGSNWNSGNTTALGSGWGVKNSNFQIVIGSADTIYFMCTIHGSGGMKARIIVQSTSQVKEQYLSEFVLKNPAAAGVFQFNKPQSSPIEITVLNSSGQVVYADKLLPNTTSIQTNLITGLYYVCMRKENEILMKQAVLMQ